MTEVTRACPYCSETIQSSAVKCRWCGEFVNAAARARRSLARPRRHGRYAAADSGGGGILVLGILGWVLCGFLGIIAWVQGNAHERGCRARGVTPSGAAVAGKILGMIATFLLIVQLFAVLFFFGVIGARR